MSVLSDGNMIKWNISYHGMCLDISGALTDTCIFSEHAVLAPSIHLASQSIRRNSSDTYCMFAQARLILVLRKGVLFSALVDAVQFGRSRLASCWWFSDTSRIIHEKKKKCHWEAQLLLCMRTEQRRNEKGQRLAYRARGRCNADVFFNFLCAPIKNVRLFALPILAENNIVSL